VRARDARGALSAVQRARGGGPCACGGCTRSNMRQEEPDRSARSGVMMLELPFWPGPLPLRAQRAGELSLCSRHGVPAVRAPARCKMPCPLAPAAARQKHRVRLRVRQRAQHVVSKLRSELFIRTHALHLRSEARTPRRARPRARPLPSRPHPPANSNSLTSSTYTLSPPCRSLAPSALPCALRPAPSPLPCPWLARTPLPPLAQ
jgi:hypothetical protein